MPRLEINMPADGPTDEGSSGEAIASMQFIRDAAMGIDRRVRDHRAGVPLEQPLPLPVIKSSLDTHSDDLARIHQMNSVAYTDGVFRFLRDWGIPVELAPSPGSMYYSDRNRDGLRYRSTKYLVDAKREDSAARADETLAIVFFERLISSSMGHGFEGWLAQQAQIGTLFREYSNRLSIDLPINIRL